jgi:valyl-tRNA synthetase
MICSYGDKYDVEAINKLKLNPKVCITKDGKLNELAGKYSGLNMRDARKEILNDLEKNNFLLKKENIKHNVNVHDKCNTEIEFLSSKQWFVKIIENKKKFIEFGKKIKWHPETMLTRYINWIKGIQWDWCISRQRHFGVPFPLWHCEKCNEIILAKEDDIPVDPLNKKIKCSCGGNGIPEKDVMDTWATSSLTPQIALNWAEKNNNFKKFYPMGLRPQAHDIIRTWAFYTIVKSIYHNENIPWKEVIISGHVLTPNGDSMHKSKGNAIEVEEVLAKYGADSLRFWSAGSKLGEDLRYLEKDLVTGKKTITKLFNAGKLILMNLKDYNNEKPDKFELIDLWLLSRLNEVIKNCTNYFDNYEYAKAKSEIDNFFWNTFCDYYLEIVKDRLYNEKSKESKISAQYTLNYSLLNILKLFAPIMPHITEEIYHLYYSKIENKKSIHINEWPKYNKELKNKKAEKIGEELIKLISEVRQFKSKNNKSLKEPINITLEKSKHQKLKHVLADFKAVTNAININFGEKFEIKF